jgi:hypothetical protein
MKSTLTTLAALLLASGAAHAQTNGLQNGGFEQLCAFCGGPFPEGWHSPGGNTLAKRRFVGDGLLPALSPVGTPGALTPHAGVAVAEIGTSGSGFFGLTTDTRNFCYCDQTCQTFCPGPYPFYDPFFDYNAGDVVVTAWYMIPADSPIVNDAAGIKINVKVENQDVATLDFFDPLNSVITGHTNGQWVQHTVVFPRSEIQRQYECNRGIIPDCGCVCVPASPLPDHVKITPGRFAANPGASGTIFWDDIQFMQLDPPPNCDPDVNQDGNVDQDDVAYLINVVGGGPNPTGIDPDFNRDGNVDQDDVSALINTVAGAPCP